MSEGHDDSSSSALVVFLHGLGDDPDSWSHQQRSLPPGLRGIAPPIRGLTAPGTFTLDGSARDIVDAINKERAQRAHLCGLSLGAMIALRVALDHPAQCASLVLSGGQDRPNHTLMRVQHAILAALPARLVAPPGVSKTAMLAVLDELAGLDVRSDLARLRVPTLVLCGARDLLNRRPARRLAHGIPGADLRIIARGGHQLNTQLPHAFTAELNAFLATTQLHRATNNRDPDLS